MSAIIDGKLDLTQSASYAHWITDVIRYADTDRQGHVNNAVFATFLESGRVAMLYPPDKLLAPEGASFVIAHLSLDFRTEINWPGEVKVGTTLLKLGSSSITLGQGLFIGAKCAATAETVIVMIDNMTRKSCPLPEQSLAELQKYARET